MDYVVVIHAAAEGGCWAEFPSLPGCFTQADTIEHLLKRAPEAVQAHVEALREDGQVVAEEPLIVATVCLPERADAPA